MPSVSELPVAQIASDTDLYLVAQSAQSRKQTLAQFKLAVLGDNVLSLAGLTLSANKGLYATGVGALATYDLSTLGRTLGGIANAAAGRAALGAMALTDTGAYAGSAASLTTSRSISATGDATWTVNFNGTASATAAITLAATGVSAGTYGSVTVNTKGLVTAATVATPITNGGTGATSATAAGTNLGTSVVGTNTDQLAKSSMIQNELANKRAWTSFTPTITSGSGTYTSAVATGTYMVMFGICFVRMQLTVTTKGTGANPSLSLPFAALAGHANDLFTAREVVVTGTGGNARVNGALTGVSISAYNVTDLITADGCTVVVTGSYPIA